MRSRIIYSLTPTNLELKKSYGFVREKSLIELCGNYWLQEVTTFSGPIYHSRNGSRVQGE